MKIIRRLFHTLAQPSGSNLTEIYLYLFADAQLSIRLASKNLIFQLLASIQASCIWLKYEHSKTILLADESLPIAWLRRSCPLFQF